MLNQEEQIHSPDATLAAETARRRTFAIISHPDAGKTTLTEKLLLYGNAIHLAGSVRARRDQRSATSDWMAIERERGISITSTVLQFPYKGCIINLLDTPGHQDFSEDTYRTLMAADSAVMVLDAAKGVEAQTRKLFEVCRQRGIPVFTFINKMDRPAQDPLGLLDEVENILGMQPVPMNWPIGDGESFLGVYDRLTAQVYLFDRTVRNQTISPQTITTLDDPRVRRGLSDARLDDLLTNIGLLDEMATFDLAQVRGGRQTPVYFGSALTNFGVRLFLDDFIQYAPAPGSYHSDMGPIPPTGPDFSGFVFKIQANMNPRHRDSVAFVRICSGRFERNMSVHHPRTTRQLRLSRPYKFFADDREVVDDAYPGDIIGLPGNDYFSIGDTINAGSTLFNYDPIPTFPAEHFARLINMDVSKQKQFIKGLDQLRTEGAMQILYEADAMRRDPILAVVGMLQFDVVEARLEGEYGVVTRRQMLPQSICRWIEGPETDIAQLPWRYGLLRAHDTAGRLVGLFNSQHELTYYQGKFPHLSFKETP
ncbi:MAG: peptide chain release factor 3 [Anaerolineales bacterium]|nr:peptide chain release factor 3 [Anaerolineales bacterium]MCB8953737.1 peptide chain release factor 3 [Ardenticatenales bacterium]